MKKSNLSTLKEALLEKWETMFWEQMYDTGLVEGNIESSKDFDWIPKTVAKAIDKAYKAGEENMRVRIIDEGVKQALKEKAGFIDQEILKEVAKKKGFINNNKE